MTVSEMLSQSGILTLLGMGVVFTFIIIMICFMGLLHAVVHAFKWDKKDEEKAAANAVAGTPAQASNADNGAVIAAIAAAIHEKESL